MKALKYVLAIAVIASVATADITFDGEAWNYTINSITTTPDIGGGNDPAIGAVTWAAELLRVSDDTVLETTSILGYQGPGVGYFVQGLVTDPIVEGTTVYMTLYNNIDANSATYFMESAPYDLQDLDNPWSSPADQVNIDFSGSSWVAVPEPATIGLMGIAGIGMFLARRKARI
jgi:hypothetical protein